MKVDNSAPKSASWGGARPGAGRKRSSSASISLRIPEDVERILAAQPNRSTFIVEAIRFYQSHITDGNHTSVL